MSVSELLLLKGGEHTKQVGQILEATQRGRNLLKGLMAFARKEVEDAEFFDLNELVRKEAELLSSTTLQRIKLELALAPRLHKIMGSSTALSTALMNLCVNAMDAMPEGGTLTLRTAGLDDQTVELVLPDATRKVNR
jgi:signal transduction histidine kinase